MKQIYVPGDSVVSCVVPYIGTWIETTMLYPRSDTPFVVPYIGTWIETLYIFGVAAIHKSYLI